MFEGVEPSELKPRPNKEGKSLEEFLNESFPSDSRHKFEMRVVEAQTGNPEFMKSFEESLQVSLCRSHAEHPRVDSVGTRMFRQLTVSEQLLLQQPVRQLQGCQMASPPQELGHGEHSSGQSG